jgi:hypothetical protein
MNNNPSPTYIGDRYRHKRTGFSGVVVTEFVPTPWTPERVRLTLEAGGVKKEFALTELEEIEE